jgi:cytidylate kinase
VAEAGLRFDWAIDPPAVLVDGEDVSVEIRGMDVSAVVSVVAAQPAVRAVLVEQQRSIAAEHSRLVSEGRDQGSVVFPDASVRFYLDADVDVRARRRVAQLVAAGQAVDHDQVIEDILQRDRRDATRTDGPLMRPPGAVMMDTGDADAEAVVTRLESVVREQLPGVFDPA